MNKHDRVVRESKIRGLEARRKALQRELNKVDDILEKVDPHRHERMKIAAERKGYV